ARLVSTCACDVQTDMTMNTRVAITAIIHRRPLIFSRQCTIPLSPLAKVCNANLSLSGLHLIVVRFPFFVGAVRDSERSDHPFRLDLPQPVNEFRRDTAFREGGDVQFPKARRERIEAVCTVDRDRDDKGHVGSKAHFAVERVTPFATEKTFA